MLAGFGPAPQHLLSDIVVHGLVGLMQPETPEVRGGETFLLFPIVAIDPGILQRLHDRGQLKLRTFLQVLYKNEGDSVEALVESASALREQYNSDAIRVSGIKVHPEGVHTSHASVMAFWPSPTSSVPQRTANVPLGTCCAAIGAASMAAPSAAASTAPRVEEENNDMTKKGIKK